MRLSLLCVASLGALVSTAATAKSDRPMGVWGGEHVGIDFEGGLSDVQFDCASGTIDDAVYPGRDGSFSVKGTYRTGPAGPVKVGQFFLSKDAVYSGQVTPGATKKAPRLMTLSVTFEDGSSLGPFTLTEGMHPQLKHCS
ncbi:MAG TPA: hypothetical protein VHE36_09115 [Sphingomicrobium sp.]|nr:hypothetical protein [Sphingomicrobium sp.]